MNEQYAALMIDLKDSRKYSDEDRNIIQRYWSSATKILNRIFHKTMKYEVDITSGDQIQGLFYRPEAAYLYYRLISICLHPIQTHAGIGVGTCKIQLSHKNTGGQDGEAYHAAKAASDQADADVGYPIILLSNTGHDRIINSVIGTASMMALRHSTNQNQLFLLTELLFPLPCEGLDLSRNDDMMELIRLKRDFDREYGEPQKSRMPLDRLPDTLGFTPAKIPMRQKAPGFVITAGKGRGIPQDLSGLLKISRQSIDTTLKNADIFHIRNMAIAAIEEMQKI